MKTNEIKKAQSVVGTDCVLADTDAQGTARVPFDAATEFFKETCRRAGLRCRPAS